MNTNKINETLTLLFTIFAITPVKSMTIGNNNNQTPKMYLCSWSFIVRCSQCFFSFIFYNSLLIFHLILFDVLFIQLFYFLFFFLVGVRMCFVISKLFYYDWHFYVVLSVVLLFFLHIHLLKHAQKETNFFSAVGI